MVELVESIPYFHDASSTTNKAITLSYLVENMYFKKFNRWKKRQTTFYLFYEMKWKKRRVIIAFPSKENKMNIFLQKVEKHFFTQMTDWNQSFFEWHFLIFLKPVWMRHCSAMKKLYFLLKRPSINLCIRFQSDAWMGS